MAQARRKSPGRRRRTVHRGWLLLVLGIGIGVAIVLLWQLLAGRGDGRSGLANLFSGGGRATETVKPVEPAKEPESAARAAKPKFDFYTILPNETVLPDGAQARAGTARAKTPPASGSKPEEGVSYVLQVGSFANFEDADQLKARLALSGLVAHIQKIALEGRGEWHRVRIGPYQRIEELDAASQQLEKMGIKTLRLKVKKGA